MLTTSIHFITNECIDNSIFSSANMKKTLGCFAAIETIVYVGFILTGFLIQSNSLPTSLNFLKGRLQLASALMITGVSLITTQALVSSIIYFANSDNS